LNELIFKYLKLQEEKMQNMIERSEFGSNWFKPAINCRHIHLLYLHKRSGWFWIQPLCSKVPIRAFCDFEDNQKSYIYHGEVTAFKNLGNEFKTLRDIRY